MALNIVCFHGFTQNSTIFQKKLMNLLKSIKGINLHFMDGFVKLPNTSNGESRAY